MIVQSMKDIRNSATTVHAIKHVTPILFCFIFALTLVGCLNKPTASLDTIAGQYQVSETNGFISSSYFYKSFEKVIEPYSNKIITISFASYPKTIVTRITDREDLHFAALRHTVIDQTMTEYVKAARDVYLIEMYDNSDELLETYSYVDGSLWMDTMPGKLSSEWRLFLKLERK